MSDYLNRVRVLDTRAIYQELDGIVSREFGAHPFGSIENRQVLELTFPDFFGFSQAFRYLLAGAQSDALFQAMSENRGLSREFELMNVVSNMLLWDECGNLSRDFATDKAAIRGILDTSGFHSELLRADAHRILGHRVEPRFSLETRRCITQLYHGFASTDPVVRCAYLVAFEYNAGVMIDGLWSSIARLTGAKQSDHAYFQGHVGGDDPAEAYHVEMTQRLIELVVPADRHDDFLEAFTEGYRVQHEWAAWLANPPNRAETPTTPDHLWHSGSCHCGAVKFEVFAPMVPDVVRCNCSVCEMSGFLSLIVPEAHFRLLSGEDALGTYRFNTGTATHTFCGGCGVKAFYRPRSHPDDYSVNVRCIDQATVRGMTITDFDGQNWEKRIDELRRVQAFRAGPRV